MNVHFNINLHSTLSGLLYSTLPKFITIDKSLFSEKEKVLIIDLSEIFRVSVNPQIFAIPNSVDSEKVIRSGIVMFLGSLQKHFTKYSREILKKNMKTFVYINEKEVLKLLELKQEKYLSSKKASSDEMFKLNVEKFFRDFSLVNFLKQLVFLSNLTDYSELGTSDSFSDYISKVVLPNNTEAEFFIITDLNTSVPLIASSFGIRKIELKRSSEQLSLIGIEDVPKILNSEKVEDFAKIYSLKMKGERVTKAKLEVPATEEEVALFNKFSIDSVPSMNAVYVKESVKEKSLNKKVSLSPAEALKLLKETPLMKTIHQLDPKYSVHLNPLSNKKKNESLLAKLISKKTVSL